MRRFLLAIETSTRAGSIALGCRDDDGLSSDRDARLDPQSSHDQDLIPCLHGLLREASVAPEAIAGIIVGRGPGSFTGLRVGAATALGLAAGGGQEVIGLPSMEASAHALLASHARVAIVLDARRGSFFVARYEHQSNLERPRALLDPTLIQGRALREIIPPGECVWSDCAELLEELLPPEVHSRCNGGRGAPEALALLRIGREIWHEERAALGDCSPLYLRPSSPGL